MINLNLGQNRLIPIKFRLIKESVMKCVIWERTKPPKKQHRKNNTEKNSTKHRNNNPEMKINENAKKWKIELCGVARAFVQISENGPRTKKFCHPCHRVWENN